MAWRKVLGLIRDADPQAEEVLGSNLTHLAFNNPAPP